MQLLRGLIAGCVRNPVLVNLMMVCLLVGGAISARRMVREVYPEFSLDHVMVEVAYPGASSEDVERAICTPIEEALRGVRGVRKVSSSAEENFGVLWIRLQHGVVDRKAVLDEVRERVGQITTFPPEALKPVIHEAVARSQVINMAVFGDLPERALKQNAQQVRDDLLAYSQISQVSLSGVRNDEITIEVSEEALLAFDLSLAEVIGVVAKSSVDVPAGVIRTADEEFTLRIAGQRYTAREYEELIVRERAGAVVRLGQIAAVRDGFEETVVRGTFNGQPAVVVQVFKTPDEDTTKIARLVRDYVEERQAYLPKGLRMSVWADGSADIDSRIAMLAENGLWGILLVFATLALFLRFRVAVWVAIGIPVSFAGALIIMHAFGETINMISLFALIMVSGIIVDDAIVIADSIHQRRRSGDTPGQASVEGAHRVALPVLGASITTIIAFIPLLYVVGIMGRLIHVLPVVVIAAIVASAVEAFGILPSHLCSRRGPEPDGEQRHPTRIRRVLDDAVDGLITRWYRPLFQVAMRYRVVTIAVALAALLAVAGLVRGGRTALVLMPREDGNIVRARVRFAEGTPASTTLATVERLEASARRLNEDPQLRPASDGPLVRQIYSLIGEFADFTTVRGNHLCEVRVELMPAEQRRIPVEQVVDQWRQSMGTIHDAMHVTIGRKPIGPIERPIEVYLFGDNLEDLGMAAERIQAKLVEFDGLHDVRNELVPGKRELRVALKPGARSLGLTLEDVARQLRYGFYGGEAVRLQRGKEQVKVRVRFPDRERRSIADLESVLITTPRGDAVPFFEVADVQWSRGYARILHQNGKRRVGVLADVDDRRANAEQILQTLEVGFLGEVMSDYDGMTYEFGGSRERMNESVESLQDGFLVAILAIFAVLAALLRSYTQPLVIVMAVPFGLVGVVVGHLILGLDLTILSLFGAVALSGVVVNDALVLLDGINRFIREGQSVWDGVAKGAQARFRAVTLTSITTVMGLLPILTESSSQAQTVKPMAVSLCFGLVFATVLTLFVVPAMYLAVNDLRRFVFWMRHGGPYPVAELVDETARERSQLAS